MNFRKWIMREMGHIDVQGVVQGKPIAVIDPMFENYPPEWQTAWQSGMYKFYGKIPGENRYLVNSPDGKGAKAVITFAPPRDSHPLPPDWWDYARVHFEDGTQKEPTKP
jgi:hypothetical protein